VSTEDIVLFSLLLYKCFALIDHPQGYFDLTARYVVPKLQPYTPSNNNIYICIYICIFHSICETLYGFSQPQTIAAEF